MASIIKSKSLRSNLIQITEINGHTVYYTIKEERFDGTSDCEGRMVKSVTVEDIYPENDWLIQECESGIYYEQLIMED